MSTKQDLKKYIVEALEHLHGSDSIIDISKEIWRRQQGNLYNGGSIFYTWQYDMRWAAHQLKLENKINTNDQRGVWTLL